MKEKCKDAVKKYRDDFSKIIKTEDRQLIRGMKEEGRCGIGKLSERVAGLKQRTEGVIISSEEYLISRNASKINLHSDALINSEAVSKFNLKFPSSFLPRIHVSFLERS